MVMKSGMSTRDTLGREFKTQQSDELHTSRLSGDPHSVRSGLMRRMDDRKGAELLNDRNFGKHRGVAPAPLDGKRVNHGDGIKVAEKILPLNDLNPQTQAELVSLFRNPAVVRAFVTNPDQTIRNIAEARPHLKEVLEGSAPFTKHGNSFEINTRSRMYGIIQRDREPAGSQVASELRDNLDGLLIGVVSPRFGGARGMETAGYELLSACAHHGGASVQAYRAAQKLTGLADSDRAIADLSIVQDLARSQRLGVAPVKGVENGPSVKVVAPTGQEGTARIAPPLPASRALPVYSPPTPPISPPMQAPLPAVVPSPLNTPPSAPSVGSEVVRAAPAAPPNIPPPQLKVVESGPDLPSMMPRELPQGVRVVPPPIQPAQPTITEPKVEAPPVARPPLESSGVSPQPPLMTPTMQRLVEVVNGSSLERQIGSPRDKPILEFSDKDHSKLKSMLTDPVVKRELLGYSDSQIKAGFESVRPDRIKYLEEWLAMNHRDAVRHPRMAESMAGITPADTNRIGQVVQIAREVSREKVAQ